MTDPVRYLADIQAYPHENEHGIADGCVLYVEIGAMRVRIALSQSYMQDLIIAMLSGNHGQSVISGDVDVHMPLGPISRFAVNDHYFTLNADLLNARKAPYYATKEE